MKPYDQTGQAVPAAGSCNSNLKHLENGWYILMTKAGEEFRAQHNLERQGFNVYGPAIEGSSKRKGRTKRVALFPGYIFAHMGAEDMSRYHRIRSTPGVFQVVCFNRIACCLYAQGRFSGPVEDLLPHSIKDGDVLIEYIRQTEHRMNQLQGSKPQLQTFREGDPVTVTDPLFEALNTEFARKLSRNRSLVLIKYLVRWRDSKDVVHEQVETQYSMVVETGSLKSTSEPDKPELVESGKGARFCDLCTNPLEGRAYYGFNNEDQPMRVGRCCRKSLPRLLNPARSDDRVLWQQIQAKVRSSVE